METLNGIKQCPLCKEEIHKDAIKCKHCGSMLSSNTTQSQNIEKNGSLWISIVSLMCGVLAMVSIFDDGYWDKDSIKGFITLVFFL